MTRGERVIAFIEKFCRVPEGALVGAPIRLEGFQRDFILEIYDNPAGTKKAYLSLARKNGKTALIACLVLAHLVGPEAKQNSQIVSGAMSREQAGIVFNLTAKMIRLNPDLEAVTRIVDSRKQLFGLPMGVEYRALAAEGKTAHGLSPVLAILDEIGQVKGPRSEYVGAIVTSQGAHESPLLIAISTQAADPADLFSIWLDDAAASGDPRIVSHVYAAPADCKLDDPEAWKAANPALGVFRSLADVEQQAAEAKRMPSAEATFRNLVLNQRVATTSPFMSRSVWEGCGAQPRPLAECVEIYAGLDLSMFSDMTAFVMVGRDAEDVWHVHPTYWLPGQGLADKARKERMPYDLWRDQGYLRTTPGPAISYADVARQIAELTDGLDITAIAFDRWKIEFLKPEFDRIGLSLPLVAHGQGFKYEEMPFALDTTESLFLRGQVRHGMHPIMTANAAGAVVVKDPAGNRKLDKHKATGKIDGLVALCMALGLASKGAEAAPTPSYEMFFL